MAGGSIPTLEEVLRVVGSSADEFADWTAAVNALERNDSTERWAKAQDALTATSNYGPLFGVTSRDIKRAATRLTNPLARPSRVSKSDRLLKRSLDFALALLLLICMLPTFVIAAIAIKIDSKGPVFVRTKRVGANGNVFELIKFRTMAVDFGPESRDSHADSNLNRMILPKLTRVGRVLRRTAIEELPQFINVLVGDMSIVGPHPPLVRDLVERPDLTSLLEVRPGVVGLWRYAADDIKLGLKDLATVDIFYVINWSLITDIKLIFKTIGDIFHGSPFRRG